MADGAAKRSSPDMVRPNMGISSDDDRSHKNIFPGLSLVFFGNSSSVKFGPENILLGEKQTNMENSAILRISPFPRKISEHHVSVINMIDLHESKHLINQLENENEIHAFIFVVKLGQLTNDDQMCLEWLQRVFGDKVLQFVMILFTYEREEECDTIKDDLKKNPVLEQMMEKCGGRYHSCNKRMNNQSEMRELMKKIERLFSENKQSYTEEMFNTVSIRSKELENSECESGQKPDMDPNAQLNVILLGKTKVGKSAAGNKILGRQAFVSKKSSTSVTRDVAVNGFPVTVYDTPGLCNTHLREEEIQQMMNEKVLQRCGSGLCVFLLVIKADRFTEEDRRTVDKIEELLGEKRLEKTWILFTRGDELEDENMTIQEFINETEPLKKLIQKYDQRYHVFNNKSGSTDQARLLLATILSKISSKVKSDEERQIPDCRPKANNEPDTPADSPSSRRIVLLGKTGFGKSATGNTILGQRVFRSEQSMSSATSKCLVKHGTVSGRSVSVVDTPGFFDTQMKPEELVTEIARSVYISSPGPHAFLIVLRVNDRFTEHERQIPQMIEMMFGKGVLKYSIILFTHGDQLKKSIVELIMENSRLRHLVQRCKGRYHVFNNVDVNNREQVNDLLQKIDTMIKENGGGHYSNDMYEDAHRLRQEEEKRRQREEDERKHQVKGNELVAYKQSNIERPKETPEYKQFYNKYQSRWKIAAFAVGSIATGELIGGCIGGAVGPVGAVVGAAAGAAAGVAVFKWLRE